MNDALECFFILDNKDYAYRVWQNIPRVGDLVELGGQNTKLYKITDIIWRENRLSGVVVPHSVYVSIYIRNISNERKDPKDL